MGPRGYRNGCTVEERTNAGDCRPGRSKTDGRGGSHLVKCSGNGNAEDGGLLYAVGVGVDGQVAFR